MKEIEDSQKRTEIAYSFTVIYHSMLVNYTESCDRRFQFDSESHLPNIVKEPLGNAIDEVDVSSAARNEDMQ